MMNKKIIIEMVILIIIGVMLIISFVDFSFLVLREIRYYTNVELTVIASFFGASIAIIFDRVWIRIRIVRGKKVEGD